MKRASFLRQALPAVLLLALASTPTMADIFPGSSGRYLTRADLADLDCNDLWVARNEIYARNGYCFRSRRAISYFGNAGCWTRNPPLNRFERANVSRIKARERVLGCRIAGGMAPPPPAGVAPPPPAAGGLWNMSCRQLWVARNSIYKRNGYCFRSRRAISYFGNAGCWTRNPRLSRQEQRRIDAIRRVERAKGCR